MKIVLLGPANSIHMRRWSNSLQDNGHEVILATQHFFDSKDFTVKQVKLPYQGKFGYVLNAPHFNRLVRDEKPDIVNVHYASGYGLCGSFNRFAPSVLSVWGSDIYEFPNKSRLHKFLLSRSLRRATLVASTSRNMASKVKEIVPSIRRIAITPFGVDLNRFKVMPARDEKLIAVGTVKTLSHTYGIDLLIKAFSRIALLNSKSANLRLIVVGGGPDRSELELLAIELGIADRVDFVGQVDHDSVPSFLNSFDIYVAASRSESFGVAVLEASACGLPVVVTDVGGLPEVVEQEVTGFIVPAEDVVALSGAIDSLVKSTKLRSLFGKNGREMVERQYDWENCVAQMEETYSAAICEFKRMTQRGPE